MFRDELLGVPAVAPWVKNLTVVAWVTVRSIPSPAQRVKGCGVAAAAVWFSALAPIQSLACEQLCAVGVAIKRRKLLSLRDSHWNIYRWRHMILGICFNVVLGKGCMEGRIWQDWSWAYGYWHHVDTWEFLVSFYLLLSVFKILHRKTIILIN